MINAKRLIFHKNHFSLLEKHIKKSKKRTKSLALQYSIKNEQKNYDNKGRLRNKVVAFRMSEEENELLNRKVALSGKTKQDYIIGSILEKEITVQGNPYVFRSLKDELVRFVNIYGTPIQDDDEEMMIWVLEMILAMRTKEKSKVLPLNK